MELIALHKLDAKLSPFLWPPFIRLGDLGGDGWLAAETIMFGSSPKGAGARPRVGLVGIPRSDLPGQPNISEKGAPIIKHRREDVFATLSNTTPTQWYGIASMKD